MKKKISKEKVFEILKYVCIGLAIIVVVGLVGSLFTRSDGDGVRVPSNNRPSIEETEPPSDSESDSITETEPAPVIKEFQFAIEYSSPYFSEVLYYEEGMTWAEWVESDYNTLDREIVAFNTSSDDLYVYLCPDAFGFEASLYPCDGYDEGAFPYNPSSTCVKTSDVISSRYYCSIGG